MKKNVLGVKIDDVNMDEAVSVVDKWLSNSEKHYIVTPNPEFLVTAKSDPEFKNILNNADLAIPDGAGLKFGGVKNTVAGTDLMENLSELASEKGYKIGLLGGRDGVAELCAKQLKNKYPKLAVKYALSGFVVPAKAGIHLNQKTWIPRTQVRDDRVDLLFVAFGHPKQEYWIAQNLDKLPVKVAMGVGGAFDYISGVVPRAPIWMRNLRVEWLYRLIVQPWRLKRQTSLLKDELLLKYIWLLTQGAD